MIGYQEIAERMMWLFFKYFFIYCENGWRWS